MSPPLRDRSDLIWASWLGTFLLTFAAVETVAYRTDRPQTLSRCLRRWLGIHPSTRRHYASAAAFLGFWIWLLVHLETLPPLTGEAQR
uniref:hypothetical protein n=1 Tax=Pseudonocardia sp. CA-138482 TaxID=3240023 RepID=UPI003F4975F6